MECPELPDLPLINRHERRQRRKVPLPPVPAFLAADALLTAREGAAFGRIGLSTFWLMVKEGRLPQPVRVTPKSPRWRLRELREAMERAA